MSHGSPTSIAVYVCTHKRNEPLRRMLDSLAVAAARVQPEVEIAIAVIDDNPDGRAKEVVEGFEGPAGTPPFVRGLHYRHSGAQNISTARNLGLETVIPLGEWVAMVDDDQVVVPEWFESMLELQARTGCDAVTGPVFNRYPTRAAAWLTDEPWGDILEAPLQPDGEQVELCSTGNSMLRSSFLTDHPDIRFKTELGVIGGEDMVFYRAATSAGLDARFSQKAVCYTEMPAERETLTYHLRASLWMGNTMAVTNLESGEAGRVRLTARAGRRMLNAALRPIQQVRQGNPSQWRFAAGLAAVGAGMLVGVFGIRISHT